MTGIERIYYILIKSSNIDVPKKTIRNTMWIKIINHILGRLQIMIQFVRWIGTKTGTKTIGSRNIP